MVQMTSYEQSDRLGQIPPYLYVRLAKIFDEKRAMGWDMIDFGIGHIRADCRGTLPLRRITVGDNESTLSSAIDDFRQIHSAWASPRRRGDFIVLRIGARGFYYAARGEKPVIRLSRLRQIHGDASSRSALIA